MSSKRIQVVTISLECMRWIPNHIGRFNLDWNWIVSFYGLQFSCPPKQCQVSGGFGVHPKYKPPPRSSNSCHPPNPPQIPRVISCGIVSQSSSSSSSFSCSLRDRDPDDLSKSQLKSPFDSATLQRRMSFKSTSGTWGSGMTLCLFVLWKAWKATICQCQKWMGNETSENF